MLGKITKLKLEIGDRALNNPLVSVVMANYKTKIEYLRDAIDSILSQTYTNFEFIIIDDASADESLNCILSYDDSRIKLIQNSKNYGLTKSLNIGFKASCGKYIVRMDSDDIAMPRRIETQVAFMENNSDVIVCGSWFEKFGVENQIRKPIIINSELYRCQLLFSNTPITMCHPSVIIRKSMLISNNIKYDETIKRAQDYALWVSCSKYGRMAIIEEVLLKYRTHNDQISIEKKEEQYGFADLISRKQLQEIGIEYQQEENRWRYDVVGNMKEYLDFYEWINKIRIANTKYNIFDNVILNQYLDQKIKNSIKRLKFSEMLKVILFSNKKTVNLFFSLSYKAIAKRIKHE